MSETINHIAEFIYQFFFIGVIGYIIKKYLAEKIMKLWVNKSERTIAIWKHYMARAKGQGHDHVDVLDCHDQQCRIFTTYAN